MEIPGITGPNDKSLGRPGAETQAAPIARERMHWRVTAFTISRPRAEQHGGLYSRDRLSFGRPVKVDTIAERHFRRLARPDHRLGRRRWLARGPRRLGFVELINTVLEI